MSRIYKRTCLECWVKFSSEDRRKVTADYYEHFDNTGHTKQRIEDGIKVRLT